MPVESTTAACFKFIAAIPFLRDEGSDFCRDRAARIAGCRPQTWTAHADAARERMGRPPPSFLCLGLGETFRPRGFDLA